MKKVLLLIVLACVEKAVMAQAPLIYKIMADSVKITNDCDTAELILENHTQNVSGFLFNKGRGRTEFRKPLIRINDSLYTIGLDSLKIPYAWVQGGNTWGTTGILGTKDNNHIDIYTNNTQIGRWTNTGNLLLGTVADTGYKLNVNGSLRAGMDALIGAQDIASISDNTALKLYGNFEMVTAPVLDQNGGFKVKKETGFNRPGATTMILTDVPMTAYDQRIFFGGPNASFFAVRTSGIDENLGGPFTRTRYTVGSDSNPSGSNQSFAWFGSSSTSEFLSNSGYPSATNYYFLETHLNAPVVSANTGQVAVRAPLKIGARQLWFYTGNNDPGAEVMRINESGNVLIGAISDQGYKFQVNGQMHLANGMGTTITTDDQNKLDIIAANARLQIGGENIIASMNLNGYFEINKNSNSYLRVSNDGNVGIGIASPGAQLHTTGTVRFAGLSNDDTLTRIVVSDANGNLYYRNASSLAASEFIGSDLAVNTVSAQKIKIMSSGAWPDYVFHAQYQLPSLKDIELYIKQNSHLPGIPSAAEVEKKGINVGENQAALLRKIEELTLYTIDQQKAIDAQKEELQTLKQEIAELKALIRNK